MTMRLTLIEGGTPVTSPDCKDQIRRWVSLGRKVVCDRGEIEMPWEPERILAVAGGEMPGGGLELLNDEDWATARVEGSTR